MAFHRRAGDAMAVRSLGVVRLEAQVERRERGHGSGHADRALGLKGGEESAYVGGRRGELGPRGRVGREEPLGHPHAADVEARRGSDAAVRAEHELGRAATDVDEERAVEERPPGGDAANHHCRLLRAGEQLGLEAVAPLDLAEEGIPVLRIANRAGRDGERAAHAMRLDFSPVLGEAVAHTGDRDGQEATPLVDALAEARDRYMSGDLGQLLALDVRDQQPGRVRPEVDRCNAGHRRGRRTRSQRVRRWAPSNDPRSTSSRARETRSRARAASRSRFERSASARRRSARAARSSNDESSSENAAPVRFICLHSSTPRTVAKTIAENASTRPARKAGRTTLRRSYQWASWDLAHRTSDPESPSFRQKRATLTIFLRV